MQEKKLAQMTLLSGKFTNIGFVFKKMNYFLVRGLPRFCVNVPASSRQFT
jgi:hypothetical protein